MAYTENVNLPGGQQAQRVELVDSLGNPSPTVRVNAGAAAVGQTLKSYIGSLSVAAGATVPLETVAPGKTFIITDIYVTGNTATQFAATITAAGVPIFQGFSKGDTGAISLTGIETGPSATGGAAVTLVLGTAAATTAAFMISGYES